MGIDLEFTPAKAAQYLEEWYYKVPVKYADYDQSVVVLAAHMSLTLFNRGAAAIFMRHFPGMFHQCPHELAIWLNDAVTGNVPQEGGPGGIYNGYMPPLLLMSCSAYLIYHQLPVSQ